MVRSGTSWNAWNAYHCDVSERLIVAMADAMVRSGLAAAGYRYLNLDDCWQQVNRTADGHVQIDEKFPSGMKALGDFLHDKGLKFGLYSSAGTNTCEGRAGGIDYEEIDAADMYQQTPLFRAVEGVVCHRGSAPGPVSVER